MKREEAKALYKYYCKLIEQLTKAKIALIESGVKSYTIGDRSLTRHDIKDLTAELDDAIKKRAMYEAIMNGRRPRKAVGVIPRDW